MITLADARSLVEGEREKQLITYVYRAHEGQTDKVGAPYHEHLYRVAKTVRPDLRVVAYAHDVLEDTQETQTSLIRAGFNAFELMLVCLLTKRDNETNTRYLLRVEEHEDAVCVKIADLVDNLSRNRMEGLDDATQERLRQKYYNALLFFADVL